jgi:hypothetical protein
METPSLGILPQISWTTFIVLISVGFLSTNYLFGNNASAEQVPRTSLNVSASNQSLAPTSPTFTEPNALMSSAIDKTRNTNATSLAAQNVIAATPKQNTSSSSIVNNTSSVINNTTSPSVSNNASSAIRSVIDQTRNINATSFGTYNIINSTASMNKTSSTNNTTNNTP